MTLTITPLPLTPEAFAPYGDVLDTKGTPDKMINQGLCGRYHDRATLDFSDGNAGISIFDAEARSLPMVLDMVERHPDGSQAFIPISRAPYLVVVAPDAGGQPGTPVAFIAQPGQGVNYHRNTWHGVCAPLSDQGQFAVIDRIGTGPNLQEHWFKEEIRIERP
ncbi:ureidoglycolate lyase [Aliiroseovarius sp. PrR006]|uniref:ureidoglycolate lyase n=1 Tax=Aliiroseovarius sp. PrR006 TaxID=2706883 RepID=UPI0013D4BBB4|nr:ureidoglycolate lyase [Aliiroseovarius sp. PrR006]NDW52732.1 ureidoglycolate lyase [Aliiroseovarius sp. PrR006]